MNAPFSKVYSRRSGLTLNLIGRKDAHTVWAIRVSDDTLHDYWHSELCHEEGANALLQEIAPLPLMRRKRAEAALAQAKGGAA